MAVVSIAVDEKLGRDVAIKILKERYENHDEIRVRFQHEARAISAFDHPNILKIYDFSGEDSRQLWIVTELIHGRNLAQILETTPSGWLHPVIAASITREICRALATAHELGIVHRDVKPENVMITHQGTVKLMDFGIAKIQRLSSMTQTGMFMGSPSYMSPEQVRGRDIDQRSDIYSLGVLFYELITGKLPFTGASTADIAMRILTGEYSHPKFIMAGVPGEIDQCITGCMELQPENRPQAINDVGDQIDQLLRDMGLESSVQELSRCFKDPKAYGDRLAKILKVTDSKPAPTVFLGASYNQFNEAIKSPIPRPDISGENLPVGSQRRDHLLPPRSVPHLSKKQLSPDLIAAHLPERRHQQRVAEATTRLLTEAIHAPKTQMPASRQIQVQPPASPPPARPQAPSRPREPVRDQVRQRDMRQVSRVVPIVPNRQAHRVRYIIHEKYPTRQGSGILSKIAFALMMLASVGIFWLGTSRNASNQKNTPVHRSKPAKQEQTSPAADSNNQASSQRTQSKPEPLDQSSTTTARQSSSSGGKDRAPASKQQQNSVRQSAAAQKPLNDRKPRPSVSDTKTSPNLNVATTAKNQPLPTAQKPQISPAISTATMRPSVDPQSPQDSEIIAVTQPPRKLPEPPKKPEATTPVSISISSMPAAELFINGKRYGTTNDQGTSSNWIDVSQGSHRLELKRSGFVTRSESITTNGDGRQKFGPYTLQRGDMNLTPKNLTYRLTLAINLPPAEVTINNIDSHATQSITLTQSTQTINLERGVYEVTMNRKGDIRKRRIDLTGAAQQLTFSVEFKDQSH